MSAAAERAAHEIAHGREIASRAEYYWGREIAAGQLCAERRAQFIIAHGGITANTHLLEIGCGTGVFTEKLAQTGARIDAVDISPDLLDMARDRSNCDHIEFILGNIETGENIQGQYDAVVGVSVLHHLDLSLALPHLIRVLKPGGRFVFTEPNLCNPQIWLERNVAWLKPLLGVSPDETAFVRTKLTALLERYGLSAVSVTPFDWLHPWTPKPLIRAVQALGHLLENTPGIREISGSLQIAARKP
jgi:2-polyprenyl-3-methyl-5-hydroxy-6-metoxy-1,4-benzoquinol methylase